MITNFVKTVKNQVKHWYIPVILGIVLILSGIYIFNTPVASYLSLAILFSVLFLITGLSEIIFAFSNKDQLDGFGWVLFSGVIDFILGLILINNPGLSLEVLPIFVGFGLLFRSMKGMAMSFDLKHYGNRSWGGLFAIALLGLIFSICMLTNLKFGAFTIVYWTAFSIIVLGVNSLFLGLSLRKLKRFGGSIDEALSKRFEEAEEEIRKRIQEKE